MIIQLIKAGGTILIVNQTLENEMLYLSNVFYRFPFSDRVKVFTDL